jgi:hypothetical protein
MLCSRPYDLKTISAGAVRQSDQIEDAVDALGRWIEVQLGRRRPGGSRPGRLQFEFDKSLGVRAA